jgi:hypothetical protein
LNPSPSRILLARHAPGKRLIHAAVSFLTKQARQLQRKDMKTLLPFLAGAFIVGTSAPAFAGNPIGAMHPEESIPDNLPRMTSPGPFDDFIKQVQQKLHEAGFDAGPVNGDFGEKTQAALAQFQIANSLPASGAIDGATLLALDLQRPAATADASAPADGSQGGDAAGAGSTRPADAR